MSDYPIKWSAPQKMGLVHAGYEPFVMISIMNGQFQQLGNTERIDPANGVIDNATMRHRWCCIDFSAIYGTPPSPMRRLSVFVIYSEDGTTWGELPASGEGAEWYVAQRFDPVGTIYPLSTTDEQRFILTGIKLRPLKFKIWVFNDTNAMLSYATATVYGINETLTEVI